MTAPKHNRSNRNQLPAAGNIGRLPPQAVDLEVLVLGALILEDDSFHAVAERLIPEAFYNEKHVRICSGIISMKNRGERVDIVTLTTELQKSGDLDFVGGAYFVSSLTNRIASSANIEAHYAIVLEKYLKRECIRSSTELIREAYDPTSDAFECLEMYERNLAALENQISIPSTDSASTVIKQVFERNAALNSGSLVGVPTGFTDLNTLTGGWQKSDLIILAARPGMGKTALAIRLAVNAAISGAPAAIFSMEMSKLQLMQRILSQQSEMPLNKFTKTGLDQGDIGFLAPHVATISNAPLYIDDTPGLSIQDLRRKARKLFREKKIKLIVADYLQLMNAGPDGKGNREQEVSAISRGLKALAKELDIPIIALSQLSRESEKRPGASKVPQLSDLRDSGAIEQDADMVIFIYRAEYYGIAEDENNESTRGKARVIIAKNRSGALDEVVLRWKAECTLFQDPHAVETLDSIYGATTSAPMQPNQQFITDNKSRQLPPEKDIDDPPPF